MAETTHLTGLHLIAGEWRDSVGPRVAPVNPATGEPLEPAFCQASDGEADLAMRAAASAARAFSNTTPAVRAGLLGAIAAGLEALGDDLLQTAARESGLPIARLTGERGRTTGQLRLFAELVRDGSWVDAVIDEADPERKPLPKPDVRRMLRPIGPVVVFDASNFPLAFGACGGDTASALAAGNPVVVKAHPAHPGTDELCAGAVLNAIREAGLPDAVFGLLHGAGAEVGGALVAHPLTQAVGFTGSLRAGRALMDLAAARPHPIRVFAEMGSLNPLVVLPGAAEERSEAIADGLAASVTMGVGQFCTKPGVVFLVDGAGADTLVARLADSLSAAGEGVLLNSGIQDGFACASLGARSIAGVRTLLEGGTAGHAGAIPMLLETDAETFCSQPVLREEVFGPAALVVRCPDEEALVKAISALDGQLTGSVHVGPSDAEALVRRVASVLECRVGRLLFNGYPTGVEVCHAMVHGGPYPATSAPDATSVGTLAIRRWACPVAYQNVPDAYLRDELKNANPCGIRRIVNGRPES